MEIQKLCVKCNHNFKTNLIIDSDNDSKLCSDCILVIKSFYTKNNSDKNVTCQSLDKYNKLTKQSVYFHLNDQLLDESPSSKSTNSKEINKNKNANKNVLLVGCGSLKRMPILESIKKLNFKRLVCLCNQKTWAYNYFDDWINAEHEDISKKENTLKVVKDYMNDNNLKFDAILTYDDYCTLVASFLANSFDLPSIPFEFVKTIKNKYEFRKLCAELKINHPQFFLIKSENRHEYINAYRNNSKIFLSKFGRSFSTMDEISINLPVIVKNPCGAGKDFVRKCNSISEYLDCIEKSIEYSDKMDLLVEEFYDGKYFK